MRWICLLTAAGCLSQGPRADAPAGCVEVTPEQLSFETKLLQVAIREVTVTNTCPGTLEIESIFFDAGAPHFSAAAPEQHIVARGASQTFMVNFVPQALGRVSDTLHVRTSDLDNPDVAVPIEATVSGPHLVTSQAALDFTDATLGCTATLPLVLRSVGTDSLVIDEVRLDQFRDTRFELDLHPETYGEPPFTLPAASATFVPQLEFHVRFRPAVHASYAEIYIVSNDAQDPRQQVVLGGIGTAATTQTDTFTFDPTLDTDVLFTLQRDDTSMADDLAAVWAAFDRYATRLGALSDDYQVALVAYDDGCVLGPQPYFDNSATASEAVEALQTMADLGFELAPRGTRFREGSALAALALSAENTGSGGCNEGLLRDDANLWVVHISDEPDASPGTWSDDVAALRALKADPASAVVHAVAGDWPDGCATARAGTGFYQQVQETGGSYHSICGDEWGDALPLPTETVLPGVSFRLTQEAVPGTVEVRVGDGPPVSYGWTYDFLSNRVTLERRLSPGHPEEVHVTYAVQPDCEDG